MLKELFEAIGKQAVQASPVVIPMKRDQDAMVRQNDGSFQYVKADNHRKHQAYDFATIAAFACRFKDKATIWHNRHEVKLFIDDSDRRESVFIKFFIAAAWNDCSEREKLKASISQRDLFNLLRTVYRSPESIDLSKKVSAVRWEVGSSGNNEVGRGKTSIGKNITQKMEGLQEIPDEILLPLPIFEDPAISATYHVRFFIDPDESNQTFKFYPLPGEVERGYQHAEDLILKAIQSELDSKQTSTPIYFGEP